MTGKALIPLNKLQQSAMASIATIEARKLSGKRLPEYPYAKVFFREFTKSTSITTHSIRKVDPTWNPERGGATKSDFLQALDRLIASSGEQWCHPLTRSVVSLIFPSSFGREHQRREHRQDINDQRHQRRKLHLKREHEYTYQTVITTAKNELRFCRPGEHKKWLSIWRDRLECEGIGIRQVELMIRDWWSAFWIARVRTDWRWCDGMYDLLNELDYVQETMSSLEFQLCCYALPLYLSSPD